MVSAPSEKKAVNVLRDAVLKYFVALAYYELMSEKVDPIHEEILSFGRFRFDPRMGVDPGPCYDNELAYLMFDLDSTIYFMEIDEAKRKAGLVPDDWEWSRCPKLVAESDLRNARREVYDTAAPLFGFPEEIHDMKIYHEIVDKTVSMVAGSRYFEAAKGGA